MCFNSTVVDENLTVHTCDTVTYVTDEDTGESAALVAHSEEARQQVHMDYCEQIETSPSFAARVRVIIAEAHSTQD